MSLHNHQLLPAPTGMATAVSPSSLPQNRCRKLKGFLPARYGKQKLVPLHKLLTVTPYPIFGIMVWYSNTTTEDRLLILTDGFNGGGGTSSDLYTTPLYTLGGSFATPAFDYDELFGQQRTRYKLDALAAVADSDLCGTNVRSLLNDWCQFGNELIFSVEGVLYRYYHTGAAEVLAKVGVATPGAPSLAGSAAGGSLTALGAYSVLTTAVDELGREGSPSADTDYTLAGGENRIVVTRGSLTVGGLTGIASWNVYATVAGGTEYYLVANVAVGTTTYNLIASDATIATGAVAPDAGENDAPNAAKIMCVWRDRLVLNDFTAESRIQISNSGSPTQFSSLALPTNLDDGLRVTVYGDGDPEVTGLASLGSMLAVFRRGTVHLLQGDTIENFQLMPIHNRGCVNPGSVQRCENEIFFLSHDGVYALLYENGYIIRKVSEEVDDLFRGFAYTDPPGEIRPQIAPTPTGVRGSISPISIEVAMQKEGNVNSFYYGNLYFLSVVDKTLVYDLISRGWSDTGWGFIYSACVYRAAFQRATSSFPMDSGGGPETVFLTRGTIYSNQSNATVTFNTFIKELYYFTSADTIYDPDAPKPDGRVFASEHTRFYDGDGPPQNRRKRMKRFIRFGETKLKPGTQIGRIRGIADGEPRTPWYPILAKMRLTRSGALFEQEVSPVMSGEDLSFECEYTTPDLVLGESLAEYQFIS